MGCDAIFSCMTVELGFVVAECRRTNWSSGYLSVRPER